MFLYCMLFSLSLFAFIFCNYVAFSVNKTNGQGTALNMLLGFMNLPFVIYWTTKIIGEMQ